MLLTEEFSVKKHYDVIVAGGCDVADIEIPYKVELTDNYAHLDNADVPKVTDGSFEVNNL